MTVSPSHISYCICHNFAHYGNHGMVFLLIHFLIQAELLSSICYCQINNLTNVKTPSSYYDLYLKSTVGFRNYHNVMASNQLFDNYSSRNHLNSSNAIKPIREKFKVLKTFKLNNVRSKRSAKSSKCLPSVRILNCGNMKSTAPSFSRYRNLLFIGSYEIDSERPECSSLKSVWMSWKLWLVKQNREEAIDLPFRDLNAYKVIFNHTYFYFPYGTFKLETNAKGVFRSDVGHSNAFCYFKVAPIPVETILLGGTLRLVDYREDVRFSILHQVDLNSYERGPKFQVWYTWRCDKKEFYFCREYKTNKPTRHIKGPFEAGQYEFTLRAVIRQPLFVITEESATRQTILFADSPTSSFSIICILNCGGVILKSNPDEVTHLKLHRKEYSYGNILNTNFTGGWWYKDESQEYVRNVSDIREYESDKYHLTVRRNALSENKTYVFYVTQNTDPTSLRLAEIKIRTCQVPRKPICSISPDSGEKGRTFFDIKCTMREEEEGLLSNVFEFYNRHGSSDRIGRHLGFSTTGGLRKVLLTRDSLYVRVINYLGAYTESLIDVKLTNPKEQPRFLKLGYNFVNNYIYKIGLISANVDIILDYPSIELNISNLVESLANERVVEITGAMYLLSALHDTACKPHITEAMTDESFEKTAQITHGVSRILREKISDRRITSRFITTERVQLFVELISNCSSVILGNKGSYDTIDSDLQIKQRSATLHATYSLDNLLTVVAFMYLPAYKDRSFYMNNITLRVLRVTESEGIGWTKEKSHLISKDGLESKSFYDRFNTDLGFYFQTIIYSINPFWWSNGDRINTDIMSRSFRKGERELETIELHERHRFNLSIHNFDPGVLSGSVSQPDPNNAPSINDFIVAVHRMDPQDYSTSFIQFLELNQTLRVNILQDQRPDYDIMLSQSTLVTRGNSNLTFTMTERNNISFFYVGILPGPEVGVNETMSYRFKLFSASCEVWKFKSWLTGNKCKVNKEYTNKYTLFCDCNMVSLTLGGSVYIPQTVFNPFSEFPMLVDVQDNAFILAYTFVIIFLFLMMRLWTVNKDRHDGKRGKMIILGDNDPDDRFGYLVGVFTGTRVLAGTTSHVCMQLVGDGGSSRKHVLKTHKRATLQSNQEDWFVIFTPRHLECLNTVVIWTDFSGSRPNWYCSKIFVCDLKTRQTDTFFVEKWLGYTMVGTRLFTRIQCAIRKEINRTSRLFFENIVYGFRELHLWASVLCRHPRSLMTRTQRLFVTLCGLSNMMLVSSVLFAVSKYQYEGVDPFYVTRGTVVVSIVASISGSVVAFVFAFAFRRCYEPTTIAPGIHEHNDYRSVYNVDRNPSDQQNKPYCLRIVQKCIYNCLQPCVMAPVVNNRRLVGFKINTHSKIVTWTLCVGVILLQMHLVIILNWTRGSVNLLFWTSVGFAVGQSIFIILPTKVFLNAYLFASIRTHYCQLLYHSLDEEEISRKIESRRADHVERCKERAFKAKYEIPDMEQVRRVRSARKKKLRMRVVLYAVSTLTCFAIICWHITNLSTSIQLFRMAVGCYEQEACVEAYPTVGEAMIQSLKNINKNVLPILFQKFWYNGANLSRGEAFQESGWLQDYMSRTVGAPRLRQFRVKRGCETRPLAGTGGAHRCTLALNDFNEDRASYSTGWARDNWTDSLFARSPWVFTPPSEALGSVVFSPSGRRCHGGGYVAHLRSTLKESQIVIRDLVNTRWVDENTRVLVVEFTSFNPSSTTYTATSVVDEALPTGLALRSFALQNVVLSAIPLSAVFFFVYFLFLAAALVVLVNVTGLLAFLRNPWNASELLLFAVYLVTVYYNALYVGKRREYREKLSDEGKEAFFSVSEVVSHMGYTKNAIGILMALVSFRILRLMRFNKDVRQYLHDLYNTRYDIFFVWVTLVLFLYIEYRLVMYLLYSPAINSLNDVLVLKAEFGETINRLQSPEAKLGAYLISITSKFGTFSFIVSLAHHYKKVLVKT